MALHASWVHGNALTVETPESLAGMRHFGWGTDILVAPGKESWFHVALPTPKTVSDLPASLLRVFLLYLAESGKIRSVHVWDGANRPQVFEGLVRDGDHRGKIDGYTKFELDTPHVVASGIGISLRFVADGGLDSSISDGHLVVVAAGAEYEVGKSKLVATRQKKNP
jgi:hypothetical protein